MSKRVKVCLLKAEARFTVNSLTVFNGSSNWLRISRRVRLIGHTKRAITLFLKGMKHVAKKSNECKHGIRVHAKYSTSTHWCFRCFVRTPSMTVTVCYDLVMTALNVNERKSSDVMSEEQVIYIKWFFFSWVVLKDAIKLSSLWPFFMSLVCQTKWSHNNTVPYFLSQ